MTKGPPEVGEQQFHGRTRIGDRRHGLSADLRPEELNAGRGLCDAVGSCHGENVPSLLVVQWRRTGIGSQKPKSTARRGATPG